MYFDIFVIFLVSMCNEHSRTAFGLNKSLHTRRDFIKILVDGAEIFPPLRSMLHANARWKYNTPRAPSCIIISTRFFFIFPKIHFALRCLLIESASSIIMDGIPPPLRLNPLVVSQTKVTVSRYPPPGHHSEKFLI